jgi:hypothetical protein
MKETDTPQGLVFMQVLIPTALGGVTSLYFFLPALSWGVLISIISPQDGLVIASPSTQNPGPDCICIPGPVTRDPALVFKLLNPHRGIRSGRGPILA